MDKRLIKIYSAALLFSALVGFSFISVKSMIGVATTLEILTYRYNFAFLGALTIVLLKGKHISFKHKEKKNLLYTAFFYIGFIILQAMGLIYTTSIVSGIIFALVPIIAKIIATVFLGEISTFIQNIFVLVSVGALIVMILLNANEINANIIGIILLLISSTSMAVSNVYMRYVRSKYSPMEISFAITLIGFILFNFTTIIVGIINNNIINYFMVLKNPGFIFASAYLGIFCTLITAFLISYMLANMEAVQATIFGNLSTAISLIAGMVILKEPLELYHIICTGLIILGVIGVSAFGKKKSNIIEGEQL
ncbi:MAG: DMT family transporter [Peptostreptococcaceae bacterium]|nr:DMT family transporter [Peptostreptococcaceae bacterium]